MRLACNILFAAFLPFLFTVYAHAAGSQTLHFDSEGNRVSGTRARQAASAAGGFRYSAPEGVDLRKDISYEYYPVFGKSFSEAVKSSEENGPFSREARKRLPTSIIWDYGVSYQYDYSSEIDEDDMTVHVAVEMRDIKATYSARVTLPALIDSTSLNPVERNLWKSHFMRLLEHEYDHVDIIENAGIKDDALRSLSEINYLIFDYRDGLDIDETVNNFLAEEGMKAGRELSRLIRERLRDYDKLTEYGRKHSMRDSFFKKKDD